MRVVHLVPALFGIDGVVGGAERYAYELARHMAEEVPTRLVSFADQPLVRNDGKLEVHALGPPWHVRGQRANPLTAGLWREFQEADVVHCHQRFVLASSLAALYCRLSGRRVFVTDLGGGGWDISLYLPTDRWYHGHLHLSEYSRTGYGHLARPFAHVILGGVDTVRFSPPVEAGPRDGAVFVGRLLPHKGVDVLIDALPTRMSLRIIGREADQRYLAELRRRAEGKAVTFDRACDDARLVEAYRRAACVVLPSVNRTVDGEEVKSAELLGQTLLEGMACGAPAIASDLGGMPEVVEDHVTGFLTPPGDAAALGERFAWLMANPEAITRMGAAGRQRVLARFTWPDVVSRCLAIYRAAL